MKTSDSIIGWNVNLPFCQVVKHYTDFDEAIENCPEGCTISQVNASDIAPYKTWAEYEKDIPEAEK